jgi:hypothetical protein
MGLQRWGNHWGDQSGVPLPFADLPPAASVPGQVRRAIDLNGAYLVSDGAYWSPLNGSAVIANAHNVNLTIQSLSTTLITAATFPGGFIRAGSRIRTWTRWDVPGLGTTSRAISLRGGAVGGGTGNSPIFDTNSVTSGTVGQMSLLNILTALGENAETRNTTRFTVGLSGASTQLNHNPIINFGAPWEIAFAGLSCAETAQTSVTASWSSGTATFTKTAHGYATGDKIVNTSFSLGGYNGTLVVTGTPTPDTWTAAIATGPGGPATGGSTSRTSNVTLVDYLIEWIQ